MIVLPVHAGIDAAIDTSVARVVSRAGELGQGFGALADALARATRGGKRFRPALVAASFESFGGDATSTPGLYPVAAAFELLHTAFVVHDDVIDHDTERRGIPNVAGEFRERARAQGADAAGSALLGDAAGILAGDLLLHEALRLVAFADVDPVARERLYALVDDAVYVSAAGELADVENSVVAGRATAEDALDAAFNKTAVYSFRAPLQAGAVLAAAPDEAMRVLEFAGGRLGLAFQLIDDLIGAFGSSEQAGRESGGDLRESKRTPLVALAQQTPSWARVNEALGMAHTGPIAVREAQVALHESGAPVRLRRFIDQTLDEVRTASLEPSLTPAAGRLLRDISDGLERRIP
ncbi:polyprenyl synthetase family protein [Microbacterium sp. CFBP9034]|uniref:polyprenyl synthetase family protein n=1 Tax=Microbacterium sp. CFBP9034 TaxID=3096540 RepID=UPI002A6A260E|nr:polyprenyl synthetase family protein [Microbacterium sp. CFBP9034]MDY0909326.1 polyprenyl synthetase family protein [Microbacterium sp. CFBP9034]